MAGKNECINGGHKDDNYLMNYYMKDISQIPCLTKERETELFRRIENLRKKIKKSINIKEEEIQQETKELRDELIVGNLKLVIKIARQYLGLGLPLPDLVQEGNIGLSKTVDKFDYRRGFKFSTYATWWIRQTITRALADQSRTIRLPIYIVELITRYYKVNEKLFKQEIESGAEEISSKMGINAEEVEELQRAILVGQKFSLDAPLKEGGDANLADIFHSDDDSGLEDGILTKTFMDRMFEVLDERERTVILLRNGFKNGTIYTLQEIGKIFNVSREMIRQIEKKAIGKLRKAITRRRRQCKIQPRKFQGEKEKP